MSDIDVSFLTMLPYSNEVSFNSHTIDCNKIFAV